MRYEKGPSRLGKVLFAMWFSTKLRLRESFEVSFRRGALNRMTRISEILLLGLLSATRSLVVPPFQKWLRTR